MPQSFLVRNGNIAVNGGNILTVDSASLASDCFCCDPPECRRCFDGTNYSAGRILPDFSVALSSSDRFYVKEEISAESLNLTNWDVFEGCCNSSSYFMQELEITGMAALNGTYYRVPDPFLVSGTPSSVAACGGRDIYADPVPADCLVTDPCYYYCPQLIYHLEKPITGTFNYTYYQSSSCPRTLSYTIQESYNLSGYAYWELSVPVGWKYGDPLTWGADMVLYGNATAVGGYGHDSKSFLMTPFQSISCSPLVAPGSDSSFNPHVGPQNPRLALSNFTMDLSCHPLYRFLIQASEHTCIDEMTPVPSPGPLSWNFPACENEETFNWVGDGPPTAGACQIGFRYNSRNYRKYDGFSASASMGW